MAEIYPINGRNPPLHGTRLTIHGHQANPYTGTRLPVHATRPCYRRPCYPRPGHPRPGHQRPASRIPASRKTPVHAHVGWWAPILILLPGRCTQTGTRAHARCRTLLHRVLTAPLSPAEKWRLALHRELEFNHSTHARL